MTELTKQIRRKVRCNSNWAKQNEVVLIIYPHGELGFRQPRRRAEYKVGLADCLRLAVTITTNKIVARVKELKKQGYGLAEARRMARKEIL